MNNIQVGQVWRSKHNQERNRTIRIDEVNNDGVTATTLTPARAGGRTGQQNAMKWLSFKSSYVLEKDIAREQSVSEFPEVRISPDGKLVAIRDERGLYNPWSVSNGGKYHDDHVADWLPMNLSPPRCSKCGGDIRVWESTAASETGRLCQNCSGIVPL